MIMVHPMPDEFMPGHMARFAHVNGYSSLSHFIDTPTFISKSANSKPHTAGICEQFCRLIDMDHHEYLSRHTMLPLDRFAALQKSMVRSYAIPKIGKQRSALLKLGEPAFFCVQCAEEDFNKYGFSYWHRSHQIRGVTWCISHGHGNPLAQSDGILCYDTQPHRARNSLIEGCKDYSSSLHINRYAHLSMNLLLMRRRYHRRHIENVIAHHLETIRLATPNQKHQKSIGDICREHFPKDWLAIYFGSIADGGGHTHCTLIDGISMPSQWIMSHNYILALSILFDSECAAIESLSIHSFSASETGILRRAEKSALIEEEYFRTDGDYDLVSEKTGIPKETVFWTLRRLGMPSLRAIPEPLKIQVLAFLSTASREELEKWKVSYAHYRYRSHKSASARVLSMALEDVLLKTSNVGSRLKIAQAIAHAED